MRTILPEKLRIRDPHPLYHSDTGDKSGVFVIPGGNGDMLLCLFTSEGGWEHLSVTVRNKRGVPLKRCAIWAQMCLAKSMFWEPEEAVMQLHPSENQYVNMHAFCLHLWRPTDGQSIPTPPPEMVGIKGIKLPV